MGARGHNAGGFAWMKWVKCPKCGFNRPLGKQAIEDGYLECQDAQKCNARIARKQVKSNR